MLVVIDPNKASAVSTNLPFTFEAVTANTIPVPAPLVEGVTVFSNAAPFSPPDVQDPNKLVPKSTSPVSWSLKIVEEVAELNEPEATLVTINEVPPFWK